MSHSNLFNYYQNLNNLSFHHHYSETELEEKIPFELDMLITFITSYLEKVERENG